MVDQPRDIAEQRDAAVQADAEEASAAAAADARQAEEEAAQVVEQDLEELQARAAQRDEYLALAQRTQADFENFRKRATRDAQAAEARGIAKVARELLPALDNLERALAAAEAEEMGTAAGPNGGDAGHVHAGGGQTEHHLTAGIRLVQQDLVAALERVGIEPFSPKGETFDPNEHEAMVQQPVEGAESGTVVEVYQQGYRLNGSIIRPARVVVAA
ncbi:nucleotide exchange factor GrpE [Capillimicrobium parvum]|uniref:Protein GrpE n=1 Tax=Capillimicrobium parvum TaxID=2884022 RepID=A0A9E6XUF6_9ACTN|nr:nucleotide exchange factor GrpE [Capillimicrobium parvum]UGS33966.1 Protein GrpE [Capillimicrobium parvum]